MYVSRPCRTRERHLTYLLQLAPLWSLPGLLHHGTIPRCVPQDLPSLTQDITDCDTGISQEDHGFFTAADPFEPSSHPALPYFTLSHQIIPQFMSGYVSMKQHERAMKHSVKLTQELMRAREEVKKARKETEQAKLSFRTLANWTYHERQILLDKLTGMRLEAEKHIKVVQQDMNDVLTDDSSMADTRDEDNSGGGEEHEPPEFTRGSSLDDAIDQLIAEEKAKLTYASF